MKLNFTQLGERVWAAMRYGEEGEQKCIQLPDSERSRLLCLITEYLSLRKIGKLSIQESYEKVQRICDMLGQENPYDLFCTQKKFQKFLGFDHIFSLVYGRLFARVPIVLDDFSPLSDEIIIHQESLKNYKEKVSTVYNDLSFLSKRSFWKKVKEIESLLSERRYSDLKVKILTFEERYQLTESLYEIVENSEDQIIGPFNGIVSTFSQIKKGEFCYFLSKKSKSSSLLLNIPNIRKNEKGFVGQKFKKTGKKI